MPQDAISAIAGRLLAMMPDIVGKEDRMARELLEVAEEVWPHELPDRDKASTTASSTTIAYRPGGRRRFGFGPMEVKA